jgi:type IV pilus assembly protein PilB
MFRKTNHTQDMGGVPGQQPSPEQNSMLDIRISVYPSIKGEVVVARILNRRDALLPIGNLGMTAATLAKVKHIISRDYGMILITGPVGSGKTTTLYSLMEELHDDERVIMTIEDPVEFHLEWLRQSELHPARGFDFNSAMRSILRQDPDILMIGEIRDQVAAQHAVTVSLVGRIVGSTIHSNSNVGTIARLIDLQIERSMIAYAINGVISQRLIRKICPQCRESYVPDQADLAYFGLSATAVQYVHGKGCEACHGTGYQGRIGIFEVLEFDSGLRSLIVEKAPMDQLEAYAIRSGMRTLKDEAAEKIVAGLTTIEEVIKYV